MHSSGGAQFPPRVPCTRTGLPRQSSSTRVRPFSRLVGDSRTRPTVHGVSLALPAPPAVNVQKLLTSISRARDTPHRHVTCHPRATGTRHTPRHPAKVPSLLNPPPPRPNPQTFSSPLSPDCKPWCEPTTGGTPPLARIPAPYVSGNPGQSTPSKMAPLWMRQRRRRGSKATLSCLAPTLSNL